MKSGGQILWKCYRHLRNLQDLLADGKTPYEIRFGEPFKGTIIRFGAMVENHPSSPKDQMRIHRFGKKVLPAIFLCCELNAERIRKGDFDSGLERFGNDGRIRWPGVWGPQGTPETGGGGLVRVPKLRVCEHLRPGWPT